MLKHGYLLCGLIMLILHIQPAQGLEKGYLGFSAGLTELDNPNYDPGFNVGVTIGGVVTKRSSLSLALEGQLTTTAIQGNTSVVGNWEVDTLGIYGAMRLGQSAFFKLKAGYGKWQINSNAGTTEGSDFSWGLGFGVPLRSGNTLEVEYAVIGETNEQEIRYLSLTYLF